MGYTTEFSGRIEINPSPLSEEMVDYLTKFSETRRMKRNIQGYGVDGEFYIDGAGPFGQNKDNTVVDSNYPPSTQPGLWCQWIPTEDGTAIVWDGGEKFYAYVEWLKYIAENFILPFGKTLDGEIIWQGEDIHDRGRIIVDKDIIKVVPEKGSEESIYLKPRDFFEKEYKKPKESNLKKILEELDIPEHMHSGVIQYVEHGVEPGGFLKAVLSNNLVDSFSKADGLNKNKIDKYITLLYNHIPADCWGSHEKVVSWMKRGGLKGSAE